MNRHERRAQAATERRNSASRKDAISLAASALAALTDPTVIGGTLFLPSGETLYLSKDQVAPVQGSAKH